MPKSTSLQFETIYKRKIFLVEFEAYDNGRTLLMKVIYDRLPLDTVDLREYDKDLFEHINSAMKNNAESYFETSKSDCYA